MNSNRKDSYSQESYLKASLITKNLGLNKEIESIQEVAIAIDPKYKNRAKVITNKYKKKIKALTTEEKRTLDYIGCGFTHSHPLEACEKLQKLGLIKQLGTVEIGVSGNKTITTETWQMTKVANRIWFNIFYEEEQFELSSFE